MKKIKITKKDLKTPETLLKKAGAINNKLKIAYPQHVYCSKKDNETLEKNLMVDYKKERKLYTDAAIQLGISHYLLNLGPNLSLEDSVPTGYILVDEVELRRSMNKDDPTFKKTKLGKVLYK